MGKKSTKKKRELFIKACISAIKGEKDQEEELNVSLLRTRFKYLERIKPCTRMESNGFRKEDTSGKPMKIKKRKKRKKKKKNKSSKSKIRKRIRTKSNSQRLCKN